MARVIMALGCDESMHCSTSATFHLCGMSLSDSGGCMPWVPSA